jgi:hypothetical protein
MKAEPNTAILEEASSEELAVYFSDKNDGDPVEFKIYGRLRGTEGTMRFVQIDEVILPEKAAGLPVNKEAEEEDLQALTP